MYRNQSCLFNYSNILTGSYQTIHTHIYTTSINVHAYAHTCMLLAGSWCDHVAKYLFSRASSVAELYHLFSQQKSKL